MCVYVKSILEYNYQFNNTTEDLQQLRNNFLDNPYNASNTVPLSSL